MKKSAIEQHFIEIYEKNADAIFRYCYYRVFEREIARELSQEAFMRAWQYIVDGKQVQNFRALIYQIARNLIYDHHNKKKNIYDDQSIMEMTIADPTDYQEKAHFNIEKNKLLEQIKKLSPEYQEVIIMRFIEGLGPREIAKIIGVSANLISVRINRAKQQLLEFYENDK